MKHEVDLSLVHDEVKAQRNTLADQLAVAGAIIVKLTKELQDAKTLIDTLQNKG